MQATAAGENNRWQAAAAAARSVARQRGEMAYHQSGSVAAKIKQRRQNRRMEWRKAKYAA